MNTHRSNYLRTISVLKEIDSGLGENEIKSKLFLSRYSYKYTVSRLLSTGLVEYTDDTLVVSQKGRNVLSFEERSGSKLDGPEMEAVSLVPDLK